MFLAAPSGPILCPEGLVVSSSVDPGVGQAERGLPGSHVPGSTQPRVARAAAGVAVAW